MNINSDMRKSNNKFQTDEREIVLIDQQHSNIQSDPDNYSYHVEDSFEEVHQMDHNDFTSSDLKEDEIKSFDPKLVSSSALSNERRLNKNSNQLDNDNKIIGIVKQSHERNDYENENTSDEVINLKKKANKLVKNKALDNKPSMDRISEVEEDKYNTIIDKYNDGLNRDEFNIDDKNFDDFMNKNINSSNLKDFDPNFNNTDSTYRFKQDMSQNNKTNVIDIKQPKTQLQFKRVEEDLYKDAIIRKKKREMIEENNVMNILLNSNKTKISNNSHKIALSKIEKYIEYIIYTFDREKNKKISFIDLGYILTEIKVFREILKEENKKQNEYSSYKEIKTELKNVRDNEKRRKLEIDFYEQIWIVLNPDNNEYIKATVLAEFLKILFSPVTSSIKEISAVLKQFLLTAFFLNSSADRKKKFISPITEKSISEDEIWPLERLVKEFLSLKQNMLAYQSINNVSKKLVTEMEQKNFSFAPQIIKNKVDKSRPKFFEGRLDALLDREKIKRQVYQETKKDMDEEKLKECTFKPQINKKNFDISSKSTENLPVHVKLYKLQGEKTEKMTKLKEQYARMKDLEENSKHTFRPVLESNLKFFQKSKNNDKPQKYDEAIDRLRSANQKKFQQKKMLEYNFDNKKYERLMKLKDQIQPFNITDLTKKNEDEEIKKIQKKRNEDEYFSIQISVAKGKDRLLKVHKNDNPAVVAENFCRVYGLKNDDIAERLAITIQNFMSIYLANNENLDLQNNKDNDIFENNETGALYQLPTNFNNTNINLSKELAASKASIISSNI